MGDTALAPQPGTCQRVPPRELLEPQGQVGTIRTQHPAAGPTRRVVQAFGTRSVACGGRRKSKSTPWSACVTVSRNSLR